MSTVYQLEPPTEGKVLVTTSHGEIEIELWAKECPKACRNFVQLCLEGYYDGVIWHRVIKDFMIQTGDPTGTGRGGESVYGEPFKDELHSRIKFNHRGQVAMANSGARDTNGSQFFITLERCDWIDRKHTIFGKVGGHTIYNALQIAEVEVEGDRPLDPAPRVLKTEVLWNPFDDVAPRARADAAAREEPGARRKKKETKKLNLLSFGEEAEATDEELRKFGKTKVSSVFHSRLAVPGSDATKSDTIRLVEPGSAEEAAVLARAEAERVAEKASKKKAKETAPGDAPGDAAEAAEAVDGHPGDEDDLDARMRRDVASSRAAAAAELAARDARDEEKRRKKAEKEEARAARDAARRARESTKLRKLGIGKAALSVSEAALMTDKEARRVETKRKRGAVAGREKDVLAKLARFQSGLAASARKEATRASDLKSGEASGNDSTQGPPGGGNRADHRADLDAGREGAVGVSRFVSQGLYYAEETDDVSDAADWKSHALRFAEGARGDPSAYAASADDYVVEDPLLERGKGALAKTDRQKKRANAWAGGSLT